MRENTRDRVPRDAEAASGPPGVGGGPGVDPVAGV